MTDYERLVRATGNKIQDCMYRGMTHPEDIARAVLALVAERLEKPTESMKMAWRRSGDVYGASTEWGGTCSDWSAMLAASPLKPKKGPPQ